MAAEPFFDTNVLIYAFAATDARKASARSLMSHGGVFSVQVANEFVDVSRRKFGWLWDEVASALDSIGVLLGTPVALTDRIHRDALGMSARYGFRIYDSLLVAAAKSAGCRILYSGDTQHGQTVDGVTITNPFLVTG